MKLAPLLLALGCPKAPPAAPVVAPAPARPPERPLLLWEVARDGHVSHLFGTCHLPLAVADVLPAPHDAHLSGARVIVVEADVAAALPADLVRLSDSGGRSLRERLGPADWRALAFRVRAAVPAPMLDRMNVWSAAGLATMIDMGVLRPGEPAPGLLDAAVIGAAPPGARRVFLETLAEQAAMFAGLEDEMLPALRSNSEDAADARREWAVVREACTGGTTAGITLQVGGPDRDPSMAAMFDDRNRRWLVVLEPELAQGGAFVAVGAGHMVGPAGLVALLEARGFTARQLSGAAPVAAIGEPLPAVSPPPIDEAALAAWSAHFPANLAGVVCADGGVLRTCLAPDAAACRDRVERGVAMCLEQYADVLGPADGTLEPEVATGVGACATASLVYDHMLAGTSLPDGCPPLLPGG